MNRLLLRIMWANQSLWQFVIASLGLCFGLVVLLVSVQLLLNANRIMKDSKDEGNYLILNKKVDEMAMLQNKKSGFHAAEIEQLESQPWVEAAAPFTTNKFDIEANFQQLGFSSNVFFEAVPDAFIDTLPEEFHWESGDKLIPVIASIDFLNLYNFGVATSQNMPQMPESLVKGFKLPVTIKGPDTSVQYQARVVAFSQRLPTVVVPQSFMEFANENFGDPKADDQPSRVIIAVKDKSDPRIVSYLEEKKYLTNTEQLDTDKLKTLINRALSASILIGMAFVLLALVVFLTSFQLIVARAKEKLNVLFDIGYKRSSILRLLSFQFLGLLLVLGALAGLGVAGIYGSLSGNLAERGLQLSPKIAEVVALGVVILTALNALNYMALRVALKKQ